MRRYKTSFSSNGNWLLSA